MLSEVRRQPNEVEAPAHVGGARGLRKFSPRSASNNSKSLYKLATWHLVTTSSERLSV
jgi:hypothetical protein